MIKVLNEFNGFRSRFSEILSDIESEIFIKIVEKGEFVSQFCDVGHTPFASNPVVKISGVNYIIYNPEIINLCGLTSSEIDACIMHEIGHYIHKGSAEGVNLEILCDNEAVRSGLSLSMLSALYKLQEKLGVNVQDRIDVLSPKIRVFRPEWTCGRYNDSKRAAIMYNLIAGFSYYFDEYSADVVGEILKVDRNGLVNITEIASITGIAQESLCQFFVSLLQNGLLVERVPTMDDIQNYRQSLLKDRINNTFWVDRPTKEKLPMEVTNAEQVYFSAVDDGKTICSCMFELTYRCSEMCIHCYNPGATRNDMEVSHRADQQELSLEDYKLVIDDMYSNGLVKVCLSGGDPFSKEFIWDLLDYLYKKGIAVDVFTNGQRLTKDVKRLADFYPRLVGVSIYSGTAEDHDAITRIPGSWSKSMQVVKQLSELAVPMHLKCCVMQPNLHSYYMVANIARECGAIPQFEINISESNDGDICAKQLRLTEEQLQVVLRDDNLALYVGKEAPNYGGQKRDLSTPSCGAGDTGFCMSPNGDLRACTAFTQVYGNLRAQSVKEIMMNSLKLLEWRNAVVADYSECGKYDYCDYCNLCAGLNYVEHGDFRKPAESNCYMAKCRFNLAHKLMEHDRPMTKAEFIEALHALPTEEVDLRRLYRKG